MNILVGADPELFVKKNGQLVSAFGLIPGTKKAPHKVLDGAVQIDGMALEFNIDPAPSEDVFISNVNSVLGQLARMVPDYELVLEAVAEFEPDYMSVQPAESLVLGCDPDFNAYTGMANVMPDGSKNMRTAAGHIHVGFTEGADVADFVHMQDCCALVKQLDVFLGIPSLLYDDCDKRREMYGKAGAFRTKPYGAEYRVLSNKWLQSDKLKSYVYKNTVSAVESMAAGEHWFHRIPDVQEVINTSNRSRAEEIMKMVGLSL